MNTIYFAYRDVEPRDLPPGVKNGLVRFMPGPGAVMIKPQVIPGKYGFKDLHISWIDITATEITGTNQEFKLLVVTYTNYALTETKRQYIAKRALDTAHQIGAM